MIIADLEDIKGRYGDGKLYVKTNEGLLEVLCGVSLKEDGFILHLERKMEEY